MRVRASLLYLKLYMKNYLTFPNLFWHNTSYQTFLEYSLLRDMSMFPIGTKQRTKYMHTDAKHQCISGISYCDLTRIT